MLSKLHAGMASTRAAHDYRRLSMEQRNNGPSLSGIDPMLSDENVFGPVRIAFSSRLQYEHFCLMPCLKRILSPVTLCRSGRFVPIRPPLNEALRRIVPPRACV